MLRINNKINKMFNQILALNFASDNESSLFSFHLPLTQCLCLPSRKPIEKKVMNLRKSFGKNCKLDSDKITVSVAQTYGRPLKMGKVSSMAYDFRVDVCLGSFVLYEIVLNNIMDPENVAQHVAKIPSHLLEWLQHFLDDYEDFLWANFPSN